MNKPKTSICDTCGTEIVYPKKCKLCGKKICYKCTIWYDTMGYIEPYCVKCWKLGIPYRAEIEQLIIENNSKLIKLKEGWANSVKQFLAHEG